MNPAATKSRYKQGSSCWGHQRIEMGVKGLWELIKPAGKPVTIETLQNKTIGVDVSLLLNQSVKGMRGRHGNPLATAHLAGLFSSTCKLLSHRIKPIFVFDGAAPELKDKTLAARRDQRFKAVRKSKSAAEKMLKNKLRCEDIKKVIKQERSLRGKVKANTSTSSQLFSNSHTVVPALEKHDSLEVLIIGMDCPVEPKQEMDGIWAEQKSLAAELARQNRRAATVTPEMYIDCQELLLKFGVPYVISPSEAEAQCAALELAGKTDGTISNDSDIFLFGSKRVYRNIFDTKMEAEEYTSDAVKRKLLLDRSSLICLAFITGSDYTDGLKGFREVSAMEILHEFSIKGFEGLEQFRCWHDEAQKGPRDPHEGRIRKRLRGVVLPSDFPSKAVYDAYSNPAVEKQTGDFEWKHPDLEFLKSFAFKILGWTKAKTNEVLNPLIKRLREKKTQMKIDQFFNQVTVYCDNVKVKSKRIQRVLKPPGNQLSSGKGGKKDKNKNIKNRNPKADKVPRKITNEKQFKNKKRPYSTELNRNKLKSEAAVIQSKVPKKE